MNNVLKKMHIDGNEFITSDEIKKICDVYKCDYYNNIRYLTSKGYLLRIFKGIFYVKSFDELKLNKIKYSHLELVSKGLELKEITNWYFGLYSALKLNNITHEYYAVDYIVNDKLFRSKPINIAGYKFKVIKLSGKLFGFGINRDRYRYSDPEKTVLDFIYIWKYNSVPTEKIIIDIEEYLEKISKNKILKYSKFYPKTVGKLISEVLENKQQLK